MTGPAFFSAPSGGGVDPDYSLVAALLHFDGANGATATVDNGPAARTVTFTSTAALSTTQARFGPSSLAPGLGGVTLANASAFLFGLNLFTIEASIYKTGTVGADRCICAMWAAGQFLWFMGVNSDALTFYINVGGFSFLSHGTIPNTGWSDVAITRDSSGHINFWINAVLVNFDAGFGGTNFASSTAPFSVGQDGGGANLFGSFVDEVRVTNGACRTITPLTAPFPDS